MGDKSPKAKNRAKKQEDARQNQKREAAAQKQLAPAAGVPVKKKP